MMAIGKKSIGQVIRNLHYCERSQNTIIYNHLKCLQECKRHVGTTSATGSQIAANVDIRQTVAPWIPIGQYEKGLLSHLTTGDILRAVFVLRMCSVNVLVERSLPLFELAMKLGPIAKWPVRTTFFNQFVGGEELTRMKQTVKSMQNRGLKLMAVPVLEEDLEDEKSSKKTYENNFESVMEFARMTASLENNKPILQLKLSAIIPPNTLVDVARAITQRGTDAQNLAKSVQEIANCMDNPASFSMNVSKENQSFFIDGLKRADDVAKLARDLSLNVLVDAEFLECQTAISTVALALMTRYNNGENNLIGNTIQAYLKAALPTLKTELEVVTKLMGVNWFGKVVRGAYMDKECKLAQKQGKSSPICDTYEDTNNSYNAIVNTIINHLANQGSAKSHLVVATHNEKSIRLAAQLMKDLNILPNDSLVKFAQIFGMADYLSTPLVRQKYTVYKSTPYGPMEKVIPYLTRRALENKSVIQGAREEKIMLGRELRSRFKMH